MGQSVSADGGRAVGDSRSRRLSAKGDDVICHALCWLLWVPDAAGHSARNRPADTPRASITRSGITDAQVLQERRKESGEGLDQPRAGGSEPPATVPLKMVTNDYMTPLFHAAAEATEEAILNALLAAGDMTGRDGISAHGLTPELLLGAIDEARRDSR